VNDSTLLLDGECGDPDGDQAVLAVRKAVPRVGGDFEEEVPIAASVGKSFLRRAAKRNPTKHKGPGVVSEFLLARLALLADELNNLQMLQSALRDTDRRQRGLKRIEGEARDSAGFGTPDTGSRAWNVIET
jgi:hypothetical protein